MNKNKGENSESLISKKQTIAVMFIVGGLFTWWYIQGRAKYKELQEHFQIADAVVTKCNYGGVKNGRETFIYFNYIIDNYLREGSSSYTISESDCEKYLVGRSFPIAYNKKDRDHVIILLNEENFSRFKMSLPDSLLWLRKYIAE